MGRFYTCANPGLSPATHFDCILRLTQLRMPWHWRTCGRITASFLMHAKRGSGTAEWRISRRARHKGLEGHGTLRYSCQRCGYAQGTRNRKAASRGGVGEPADDHTAHARKNVSTAVSTTPATQHCGIHFRDAATRKELRIAKPQAADEVESRRSTTRSIYAHKYVSTADTTTPVIQHCGMPFRDAATGKELGIAKPQAADGVRG